MRAASWNIDTSGTNLGWGSGLNADTVGCTTAEMYQQSNYVGWDFTTIWSIVDGSAYPELRNMP